MTAKPNYKRGPYKLVLTDGDGTVIDTWDVYQDIDVPLTETIDEQIVNHDNR